jgi:hypothetical protein
MILRSKGRNMSNGVSTSTGAPKGRSCLLYGCLTLVVVLVAVGIGGYFLVRYGVNQLTAFVQQYTETTPMAIERVEVEPGEYEAIEQRLAGFGEALDKGTRVEPLVLTGREINVLIAGHPELKAWRDRVYVRIVGDQIQADVSLPLDELANLPLMSGIKGRYLNGRAGLRASLVNGRLAVNLDSVEVKGEPLPENVMMQLRQHNLAQDAGRNRELSGTLGQLRSLEVADGQITIKAAGTE